MGFKAKPKAPDVPSTPKSPDAPDAPSQQAWDRAVPGAKKGAPANLTNPDINVRADFFKRYDFNAPEFKNMSPRNQKKLLEFNLTGKENPTPTELKKGFHKMSLKTHPDKGGDPVAFKNMKSSYDRLIDAPDSFKNPPAYTGTTWGTTHAPTYGNISGTAPPSYADFMGGKNTAPATYGYAKVPRFQSGPLSFGSASGYKSPQNFSDKFSQYVLDPLKRNPGKTAAVGLGGVALLSSTSSGTPSTEPTYSDTELPPSGPIDYGY